MMNRGQHPNSLANLETYRESPSRSQKVPPVRRLSSVEAAWLGAMVEGEGSISVRVKIDRGWTTAGMKTLYRLDQAEKISPNYVTVYSSDVEIISACLRLTQAGTVWYRPPRPDYRSPNGRQAFARKDGWQWATKSAVQAEQLLAQLVPYLTSKKLLAMVSIPVSGSGCHPSHFEGPPLPGKTDEEVTRNWEQFKKEDKVDPRATRRRHHWKAGHEPEYLEPESGWKYVKIEAEEPTEPDQRHLLHGGPPSGLNCERCGEETRVVGSMSVWEQYQQREVEVVNLANMSEARKKELQQQRVVILKCPSCRKTYQWAEEMLPKRLGHE